jgi:hypothetical protein
MSVPPPRMIGWFMLKKPEMSATKPALRVSQMSQLMAGRGFLESEATSRGRQSHESEDECCKQLRDGNFIVSLRPKKHNACFYLAPDTVLHHSVRFDAPPGTDNKENSRNNLKNASDQNSTFFGW